MSDRIDSTSKVTPLRDVFLILASLVVVLAGARYASSLLEPLFLALFLAIICGSPISSLKSRGLPAWMASSIVGTVALTVVVLLAILLGRTAGAFHDELPNYQAQFNELLASWISWLAERSVELDTDAIAGILDPASALGFFGGFLSGLGDVLGNFVLILFTVVFILADAPSFPGKLASGENRNYHRHLTAFQDLAQAMNSYIATKALVSAVTGILIWLGLLLLEVKFAALWGFLAFLLNFIPNIGSTVAAVPAVLLSFLEMNLLLTGSIIALYLMVNILIGNLIEPRWMGQRVGLSTLAVFLSLVFWGWMFGPVGMFLSVPLTMLLKYLAMQNNDTVWISVLLSNSPGEAQGATEPATTINGPGISEPESGEEV
jgi:predicted PurR-regulated permease PerM